ncbi:leucine rich adaptor protein 1-like isoform X2 [Sparus aurata]|uniref:Leucine rich adaptor protein 1-like n=1 Tax=Sparus aurata TaxID=8175 RepID=A0A671W6G8_SPAAU|nr:leucine rich adaptor protein 1-like isoform X2 [Sparus aurata]
MEEELLNDSLPCLKELENKVGRKTPESLLVWMRDAADCEDGWRSDAVDRGDRSSAAGDSFSDKISNLKQEMRWLRCADVRILRQLVAVHEGIEAMRWLMEERDTFLSRGSSLTGSLSSLATVEEHGASMSPCRDSLSPTQDFTETTGEESEDQQPHSDHGDSNHRSSFDMLSPAFAEARPPSPSSFSEFEVTRSTHSPASSGPANGVASASSPRAQPEDSAVDLSQDMTAGGLDIIRRALLRSSRARREVKVGNGCSAPTKQSEEKQTEHHTQESSRASQNNMMQKEESAPNKETGLLGYDAQWCWVESQDDVTFV